MSNARRRSLAQRHCVPCAGGTPPLTRDRVAELLREVPTWSLRNDPPMAIARMIRCRDFREACSRFVAVALLCEAEGHHADFHLTGWRNLEFALTTHAIGGLSENDFIVAAKIDRLLTQQ